MSCPAFSPGATPAATSSPAVWNATRNRGRLPPPISFAGSTASAACPPSNSPPASTPSPPASSRLSLPQPPIRSPAKAAPHFTPQLRDALGRRSPLVTRHFLPQPHNTVVSNPRGERLTSPAATKRQQDNESACHFRLHMTYAMSVNIRDKLGKLSAAKREKVNTRAAEIIAGELSLRIEDDELRITTLKRNIARAQLLVRKHVKPGTSLVDELIAKRREAARNE